MLVRTAKIANILIEKTLDTKEQELVKKEVKNANKLVEGIIPVSYFPSVNSMYGFNRRTGAVYLYPELGELKQKMRTWLSNKFTGHELDFYDGPMFINLIYLMKSNLESRDLDNMQKFVQDTLASFFNFNDARIYDSRSSKSLINNEDVKTELLYFRLDKDARKEDQIYLDLTQLMVNTEV